MTRTAFNLLGAALLLTIGSLTLTGCSSKVERRPGEPIPTHTAVISTSMGDIEIELYGKDAPKTVANFVGLANKGYFEGILVHRVVPGFVIQAGDPKTKDPSLRGEWGTGGESIYGGTFNDELDPNSPSGKLGYVEGVVAMANRGANTNTSQFFIVLQNAPQLPYNYTIFGKVTKGMNIAHDIEKAPIDGQGHPVTPVTIGSVKVEEE
jgi:cyclophilin family peptidyl-prolyl cis-trans isomerase